MFQLLKDRKFAGGVMTGTMLSILFVVPPILIGAKQGADRVLLAAQASRVSLDSCKSVLADLNSHWTLIVDKPAPAIAPAQLLHGLVEIGPGEALTGVQSPVTRWAIPAKIKPWVYGAANGARYYYVDPQTHEMDGPYLPLDGSAQQTAQVLP